MCLHCKFYNILRETLSVCVNGLNPYLCKTCEERWWCYKENVYEIEVLWTWWSMNVGYDWKKCNIAILVGTLPLKIIWKGSMGWGGVCFIIILRNHILFHDYGLYLVGAGPLMNDWWPTKHEMKVKFPCCPTTYFSMEWPLVIYTQPVGCGLLIEWFIGAWLVSV